MDTKFVTATRDTDLGLGRILLLVLVASVFSLGLQAKLSLYHVQTQTSRVAFSKLLSRRPDSLLEHLDRKHSSPSKLRLQDAPLSLSSMMPNAGILRRSFLYPPVTSNSHYLRAEVFPKPPPFLEKDLNSFDEVV